MYSSELLADLGTDFVLLARGVLFSNSETNENLTFASLAPFEYFYFLLTYYCPKYAWMGTSSGIGNRTTNTRMLVVLILVVRVVRVKALVVS